jgi:hypothetical protein
MQLRKERFTMEIPSSGTALENTEIPASIGRDRKIAHRATFHLAQHAHFRYHMDCLEIDCREGKIFVDGRLPSFYLKQVLQTTLRDVPGVRRIDNRVNVVSSTGLSSTCGPYY